MKSYFINTLLKVLLYNSIERLLYCLKVQEKEPRSLPEG